MLNGEKRIERPLRWGMVGGGRTGQVGYKHRTGALRDNNAYRLVCGAFDLDDARGRDFGRQVSVEDERCYTDYKQLIAKETAREDGVEVVSIATPNFTHHEITKACLEAGLHVICEKPLFFTVAECEAIAALAEQRGLIVGVTYGFTGHPLVHQMAAMVAKGMLGDIGTHLYYLSEIVLPHMKIERLLCDRHSIIKSRAPLEDNAYVLSHYDNGAVGRLWVSSVNAGSMASQRYRFVGSKASVEWTDTQPNELIYEIQGEPPQILHHGMPYLEEESLQYERMGALHTEGLGDSWSNIYLWIAQAIDAKSRGDEAFLKAHHYPGIKAGTEGVRWLENCVRSADAGSVWVEFR